MGLRCCAQAFSSCGKWGLLFIVVRGPLTITAFLVAEHRLQTRRLSNCGSRAQLLRGMWDLPRPGLKPVSPALAGRLSTTAPPRKPKGLTLIATLYLSRISFYSTDLCGSHVAFFGRQNMYKIFYPPHHVYIFIDFIKYLSFIEV